MLPRVVWSRLRRRTQSSAGRRTFACAADQQAILVRGVSENSGFGIELDFARTLAEATGG